jgi:hypothetical protein
MGLKVSCAGVGLGVALVLGVLGCGGDKPTIKTAEDRLAEQERLAYEDEQRERAKPKEAVPAAEEEQAGAFDEQQADLELKRATRSAETCAEVVEGSPTGETSVTITFANDGTVGEARVPAPFAGTRGGDCILNAYKGVIVPPYTGELKIMTWALTIKAPPKAAKGDKKKKK